MKRILSLMIAAILVLGLISGAAESAVEYIPAPYTVADEANITDAYFDPIVYFNAEGAAVSVTMLGVLKVDGLYFKDIDNDGEFDDFEDWRLEADVRAAALAAVLTNEQKAAYLCVNMAGNPVANAMADAVNEKGGIRMDALLSAETTDAILTGGLRHAVYTGGMEYDVVLVALMNNAANQAAEYAAVCGGAPYLPFATFAQDAYADAELLAAQGMVQDSSEVVVPGEAGVAEAINSGACAVAADAADVLAALENGLIDQATLDAAVTARLACEIANGRLDNPYVNPAYAEQIRAALENPAE